MLFTDFHTTAVARLNEDAYYSDPDKLVTVLAENRMDFLTELNDSLGRTGIGGVVAVTRIERGDHHNELVVTVVLQIHEVPFINRATTGTQKTAQDLLVKSMSLWGNGWTPDEDVWSPFEFQRLDLTDIDEEHGRVTWTAEYQTRTSVETALTYLSNQADAVLVDESGNPLLVSPTDP